MTRASNLALARRLYEAQARHDNDTIFSIYHPDIEWDASPGGGVVGGIFHGHAGVREFMRDWTRTWSDWHTEVAEAYERGDRVLLVIRDRARIAGSAGWIGRQYGHLLTFRDSKIVRATLYMDVDEARRDLERED
jgi:ketosteroid isomerase-like protein